MDDARWAEVTALAAPAIEAATEQCTTYDWCILGGSVGHEDGHGGAAIDLVGDFDQEGDDQANVGWWCWLAHDAGAAQVDLVIEGRVAAGVKALSTQVPLSGVLLTLLASATPEARDRLLAVLESVRGEVVR
ncbi:MAG: hypothetical protein OSB43_08935 [Nocardioides sp.]|uniref:hypothetical protein n=1 Tax=Nocardioides sp. TaxID=35761 RepID=UPI002383D7B6|nr:hypothetical protein [Nocardioides sp.]MDE0776383.1 hypothetical protein [Nocardioides sp.]